MKYPHIARAQQSVIFLVLLSCVWKPWSDKGNVIDISLYPGACSGGTGCFFSQSTMNRKAGGGLNSRLHFSRNHSNSLGNSAEMYWKFTRNICAVSSRGKLQWYATALRRYSLILRQDSNDLTSPRFLSRVFAHWLPMRLCVHDIKKERNQRAYYSSVYLFFSPHGPSCRHMDSGTCLKLPPWRDKLQGGIPWSTRNPIGMWVGNVVNDRDTLASDGVCHSRIMTRASARVCVCKCFHVYVFVCVNAFMCVFVCVRISIQFCLLVCMYLHAKISR